MTKLVSRNDEMEYHAKRFAAHVGEIADASLASDALTNEDRKALELGRGNFVHYFDQIAKLLDSLKASEVEFGYECLWNVISGAFYVGSRGTVTDSASRKLKADQAALARLARAHSPEELALAAAIKQEHPSGACAQPSKMAGSILERCKSATRIGRVCPCEGGRH